jgi:uncharacterized protein involved in exopolysaccharide biosynthesis
MAKSPQTSQDAASEEQSSSATPVKEMPVLAAVHGEARAFSGREFVRTGFRRILVTVALSLHRKLAKAESAIWVFLEAHAATSLENPFRFPGRQLLALRAELDWVKIQIARARGELLGLKQRRDAISEAEVGEPSRYLDDQIAEVSSRLLDLEAGRTRLEGEITASDEPLRRLLGLLTKQQTLARECDATDDFLDRQRERLAQVLPTSGVHDIVVLPRRPVPRSASRPMRRLILAVGSVAAGALGVLAVLLLGD